MPLLLLVPIVLLLIALMIPVSLVQRYRVGRARRRARGWVASVNVLMLCLSIGMFLVSAAITSIWVSEAVLYAAAGLVGGVTLGAAGLALTRWEHGPDAVHYTPNRWLVLGITLVVSVRVVYGFWRGWQTWQVAGGTASWLAVSGIAESLAAGGIVLGYYVTYWTGVRRRAGSRAGY